MSHNQRRVAKRTSNRSRQKQARYAIQEGARLYALFLAVLAQKGGEIVITQGTIDQVGANLANLGYRIVAGATPNEYLIRLTEGPNDSPVEQEKPNVVITRVEEPGNPVDGGPDIDHLGQ